MSDLKFMKPFLTKINNLYNPSVRILKTKVDNDSIYNERFCIHNLFEYENIIRWSESNSLRGTKKI